MMALRAVLAAALLMLFAMSASATPPNIVVVLVDDISACWIGEYTEDIAGCSEGVLTGTATTLTPTIDAMADAGVMFTTAWAMPVCTPTRFSIMTGTYPRVTGGIGDAVDPETASGFKDLHPARPNLARTMSANGYRTGIIGKWHLSARERGNGSSADGNGQLTQPSSVGFEEGEGTIGNPKHDITGIATGVGTGVWTDWPDVDFVTGVAVKNETYLTTEQIDDAIAFIGDVDARPWFLYLSTNVVHSPEHFPPQPLFTAHIDCDNNAGVPPNDVDTDDQCYKADIEALDTELARLFADGNWDWTDTVVILVGDNGTPQSTARATNINWEQGRMKNTVGNGGVWVPLIVRGVGVATGTSAELVETIDIHATVLELAGIGPDVYGHKTGSMMPSNGGKTIPYRSVSFAQSLSDVSYAGGRDCIYSERFDDDVPYATTGGHEEAISNGTYKLIVHHDTAATYPEELFLVTNQYEAEGEDRWTTNNGAYTPTEQAACEDLQAKLALMHDGTVSNPCR